MNIRPISMPTQHDPRPASDSIVVAVNGGSSGWQALDWAAAEAAARHSSLWIVHVIVPPVVMIDPLGSTGPAWIGRGASEAGALVLEEAVRRARQIAPDTTVTASMSCGGLAASIRAAGRDSALTVVGRGRPRRFSSWSRSRRIARRAVGPVAIVELDDEGRSGPSAGRVVLGIDDTAGPPCAVAYAFRAASRRGVGLTVIHACNAWPALVDERAGSCRGIEVLRRLATIDDVLQIYRDAYPNVDVRRRFVPGSPGLALVDESKAAALVVIGGHSLDRLRRARSGSVARVALGHARSPLAIIRASMPRGGH